MTEFHALLIDDDEDLLNTLSVGLTRAGFTVSTASGGIDGLEKLSAAGFDVDIVVTDILMKDGEGIETLQRIKKENPGVPAIGISGNPMYLKMFTMLGGYGTLQKPFRIAALVEMINQALKER